MKYLIILLLVVNSLEAAPPPGRTLFQSKIKSNLSVTAAAAPCAYPSSLSDGDDYLTITSLGGIYDTNKGLVSFWIKSTDDTSSDYILQNNIAGFFITRENTGFIRVVCTAPGGANRLQLDSSITITNDGFWHHVISSWDLGTAGAAWLYIDGVDVTTTTTFTDGMIDYTSDYAIGANTAGASVFSGYMSEFYFTNVFLDITVAANRDKFYNSTTRTPVSLGADGSTPLGGQPIIYLHTAVPNWEVNSGGGGNFTEAGTGGFVDGGSVTPCEGFQWNYFATQFTTDDYIQAALTVGADGKTGLMSFWILTHSSGSMIFFTTSGLDNFVLKNADGTIQVVMKDAIGPTTRLDLKSTASVNGGAWHHVAVMWDTTDTAKCEIYVDGTAGTTKTTVDSSQNIDYTGYTWRMNTGGATLDADVCEFYFAPNQWVNLASDITKFRTVGVKPENLGLTGNTPTGTTPVVYLHNPYATFQTNLGSGGNFTVQSGTLTSAATKP